MTRSADELEALGAFYVGRRVDESQARTDEPVLYTAKDLTTHGIAVGMTGSGKTGLSVVMLEEAAIDGIPSIVIDPKGDLGNVFLTFPELRGQDFAPWVDAAEAKRNGRSVADEATAVAKRWESGLQEWSQSGARIGKFASSVERVLYTPGSETGRPLSVLGRFAPPAKGADAEARREEAVASASALCALVDLDADPVTSRPHILISTILLAAFESGRGIELAELVREVMNPSFDRVGALTLEDFYPSADRKKLGMRLNNLLASPGFSAWMKGDPLDVESLLYAPDGRPRMSVLCIAHLSEQERMFFVTLLLTRVLSWLRGQPGTSSLRALLFMDEVFGFFPPVAEPPSKKPMLTLLKQARAYGLGVLLSTQNPVDVDYKGLSNCGTWFLGRLSTERDVDRVIEGLAGASKASGVTFDEAEVRKMLAGLDSRRFWMRNVHEDAPVVFETRWALSYLRGPLTREQLAGLVETSPSPAEDTPVDGAADSGAEGEASNDASTARPILDDSVIERFLAPPPGGDGSVEWRPHALAVARLHHTHRASGLDEWTTVGRVAALTETPEATWSRAEEMSPDGLNLADAPEGGGRFLALPRFLSKKSGMRDLERTLVQRLYESSDRKVFRCDKERAWSNEGESRASFVSRMELRVRESRDEALEKLRAKYQKRITALEAKVRRARDKVSREQDQYRAKQIDTAVSVGSTVLGALVGRRVLGRATTAARGANRISKEAGDVKRAEDALRDVEEDLADLQIEADDELTRLRSALIQAPPITERDVRPTKKDIGVDSLMLLWVARRVG